MKKFGLSEARTRQFYPVLTKVGPRLPLKPEVYRTLERIGWERREVAEELTHSEGVLKLVQDLSRGRSISHKNEATRVNLRWRQTSYGYVGTTVETDYWPENPTFNGSHKFELHIGEGGSVRLIYAGSFFSKWPGPMTSDGIEYLSVGGSLACTRNPGVEELVQMRMERIRDIAETYLIREQLQERWQSRPSVQQVHKLTVSST